MNIVNLRRQSGAGNVLARFDIEVTPEIKLLDWALKKGGRVFPPSTRYGPPAAFITPELASEIARLAMGGVGLDDTNR